MQAEPMTESTTEIQDRLLSDHREIEELLDRLLVAFRADDRERIQTVWSEFDARLSGHLDAEEQFLVPLLMRTNERSGRAILAEHKLIRSRLLELGAGVDLHIVRLTTARAFMDELRAHARHEDELLYRWADEHVGEPERAAFLSALGEAVKRKILRKAE